VSDKLIAQNGINLQELSRVTEQLAPLVSKGSTSDLDVIETSAVAAMLHSFYTLIEKIMELIAREIDQAVPGSGTWHRDLIGQMTQPTAFRPAVISTRRHRNPPPGSRPSAASRFYCSANC